LLISSNFLRTGDPYGARPEKRGFSYTKRIMGVVLEQDHVFIGISQLEACGVD